MPNFKEFKLAIQQQMDKMSKGQLFRVDVSGDELWGTYLKSFPEGTNPIYKERTEHDCTCCKQFIRACGNVVSIENNKLVSIWDISPTNVLSSYVAVAKALSKLVRSKKITDIFVYDNKNIGTNSNVQLLESGETLRWNHFHYELDSKLVMKKDDIGSFLSDKRSSHDVFERGLKEFTIEALDTVIELGEQNSTYRVSEFLKSIVTFKAFKKAYDSIDNEKEKSNFCWSIDNPVIAIRNTMIGTLITDLSEGMGLNTAVSRYESKAAPENYKRPKALITKAMITKAQDKVAELDIQDALSRRYAVTDDITIGNVLYADRSVKKELGVFDELLAETEDKVKNLDKVDEVPIHDFINDIVPKAKSIELMFDNKHENNLVSLIAPVHVDAKHILKWGNNFSWNYNGEVTDSMRDRVKALGGRIDGDFRFTHSWNEIEPNRSLMDLHVFIPGSTQQKQDGMNDKYGNSCRVGWNQRKHTQTGGEQDVDHVNPAKVGFVPVENITFPSIKRMPEGEYVCKIHNWSFRQSGGRGRAEIEVGGNIYQYEYPATKNKEWVTIATVTLKDGVFKVHSNLKESKSTKEVWGINTNKFHKVRMIMNSPNHWDGNSTGNKHYFFMLENCLNEGTARGFFNEFLDESLTEHRKVFEVLGSKMKVEPSDNQLSGLGFSTTKRNEVLCRVTGSFSRVIKIKF